jgi:hypothetical protein
MEEVGWAPVLATLNIGVTVFEGEIDMSGFQTRPS